MPPTAIVAPRSSPEPRRLATVSRPICFSLRRWAKRSLLGPRSRHADRSASSKSASLSLGKLRAFLHSLCKVIALVLGHCLLALRIERVKLLRVLEHENLLQVVVVVVRR